jgi:hypothetical protein
MANSSICEGQREDIRQEARKLQPISTSGNKVPNQEVPRLDKNKLFIYPKNFDADNKKARTVVRKEEAWFWDKTFIIVFGAVC